MEKEGLQKPVPKEITKFENPTVLDGEILKEYYILTCVCAKCNSNYPIKSKNTDIKHFEQWLCDKCMGKHHESKNRCICGGDCGQCDEGFGLFD